MGSLHFLHFLFSINLDPALAIIVPSFSSGLGSYILHLCNPLQISGLRISVFLKDRLNCLIIGSSIGGDCSIKRSYSERHTFKKSFAGFLRDGSNANSTEIFRPNLDHWISHNRWDSINSAYLKKFCNVDRIPAKIFTPPTHAIAICLCSSGTNESIAKLAVPVNVDNIITGIVNE